MVVLINPVGHLAGDISDADTVGAVLAVVHELAGVHLDLAVLAAAGAQLDLGRRFTV